MEFYSKYAQGDKWIQVSGSGESIQDCTVIWGHSESAKEDYDKMMSFQTGPTPTHGVVEFNKYNRNMQVQIMRFGYAPDYKYDSSYFGDTIEINLGKLT